MNLKQQFKESAFSSKDTFLKCEDLENGKEYAITYNPADQPDYDAPRPLLDWWGEQKYLFESLKGCAVRLYLEVSKTGRHHWHGFIKILNRIKFCIHDTCRLIKHGSTMIKPIGLPSQDESEQRCEWLCYCLKLQQDIQEYIVSESFAPLKLLKREFSDHFLTLSTKIK